MTTQLNTPGAIWWLVVAGIVIVVVTWVASFLRERKHKLRMRVRTRRNDTINLRNAEEARRDFNQGSR